MRPGAAHVELTADGALCAVLGRLRVDTMIGNICGYQVTGPYRWWRAIGPRASLVDHGFTFGTSSHGGVCVCFCEPIAFAMRGGRMAALTVTVDDIAGFSAALDARGVAGADRRGG